MSINFYNLVEKMIVKDPNFNRWDFLSRHASLEFIEKHLNDDSYHFDWLEVAQNKNLTIDFVLKYYNYFIKNQVILELGEYVIDDLEFIKNDINHVKLIHEDVYKDVKFFKLNFILCKNEKICDNYSRFYKEYESTNNPYDCESCGDYGYMESCRDIMRRRLYGYKIVDIDYSLIVYNRVLYIVLFEHSKPAIDLLISGIQIEKKNHFFGDKKGIIREISRNKAISFDDKWRTRDIISWNWNEYQYDNSITYEQYQKIKDFISYTDWLDKYFTEINQDFLDKVLNGEIKVKMLLEVLEDNPEKNKNIIKSYNRLHELIDKIVNYKNANRFLFSIFSDIVKIDVVLNNLHLDWDLDKIIERNDVSFDVIKKIHDYRQNNNKNFMSKLPYSKITTKEWVTEDLILNNIDFPWSLSTLLNGKENDRVRL